MTTTDDEARRDVDAAVFTAAAFAAGGYLQRFLAAELAPAAAGSELFAAWMLAPVLMQGAIGFLGLAWILRARHHQLLLWIAGMLGWTLASVLALVLVGWSFYESHMLFLLGLVTGLFLATTMRVDASATLKMGAIYTIGFAAAWAVFLAGLAAIVLLVEQGPAWLEPAGFSISALATIPAIAHDLVLGATAAIGVVWAGSQSRLPNWTIVRAGAARTPLLHSPAGAL